MRDRRARRQLSVGRRSRRAADARENQDDAAGRAAYRWRAYVAKHGAGSRMAGPAIGATRQEARPRTDGPGVPDAQSAFTARVLRAKGRRRFRDQNEPWRPARVARLSGAVHGEGSYLPRPGDPADQRDRFGQVEVDV